MDITNELRAIRRKMGKSQKEFANQLSIPQTTWANYETGKASPPLKILMKLAEMGYTIPGLTTGIVSDLKAQGLVTNSAEAERNLEKRIMPLDTPLDEMPELTNKISKNGFVVPLYEQKMSAGHGQPLPEDDTPIGYITVPETLKKYGTHLAALYVKGDSMEPTLSRGDLIVCDSCGWDGEGIYALQMDGNGFVKRLSRKPGKYVVISDNPKYAPWEEPAESEAIRIIGRVHYTLKHVE